MNETEKAKKAINKLNKSQPTQYVDDGYKKMREERLARKPEERAKNGSLFKLLVGCMINQIEITSEIKTEVYKLQKDFFEKNPKRIFPDPIIFKEVLESGQMNKYFSNIIERIIDQDIRYSKFST